MKQRFFYPAPTSMVSNLKGALVGRTPMKQGAMAHRDGILCWKHVLAKLLRGKHSGVAAATLLKETLVLDTGSAHLCYCTCEAGVGWMPLEFDDAGGVDHEAVRDAGHISCRHQRTADPAL